MCKYRKQIKPNSMFKLILSFACFTVLLFSCTKNADNSTLSDTASIVPASSVPQEVLSSFSSSFSGSSEVEWRHHSNDDFSSQFNQSGQRHEARFDDKGHNSSHKVISLTAVPKAVLDAFATQFPTDVVYEWNLRSDGTWRAHYMRGTVKWEATFSATGTLLKNEKAS